MHSFWLIISTRSQKRRTRH